MADQYSDMLTSTTLAALWGADANGAGGQQSVAALMRAKVSATRQVWVTGTNGNDANAALSGGANSSNGFATIQAAVDWIHANLDLCGARNRYSVFVQIQQAGGPYTQQVIVSGPLPGDGLIWFNGAGGTAIWTVSGAHCLVVRDGAKVLLGSMRLKTTGGFGHCLSIVNGQVTAQPGLEFDSAIGAHVDVNGGLFQSGAGYKVMGGAANHWHCAGWGSVGVAHLVTVENTPAFSGAFAAVSNGMIGLLGASFSGAATGPRFIAHYGGQIRTGQDAYAGYLSFIPGSTPGSCDRGGSYDNYGKSASTLLVHEQKTAAFQIVVPAYTRIAAITLKEGNVASVTGGINIGTTNGGNDVVAAQALAQNALVDCNPLKRVFSQASDTILYVTAATAWNGANVSLSLIIDKLY